MERILIPIFNLYSPVSRIKVESISRRIKDGTIVENRDKVLVIKCLQSLIIELENKLAKIEFFFSFEIKMKKSNK